MTLATTTEPQTDTQTVTCSADGDDLERCVRHWNKQGYIVLGLTADPNQFTLLIKKVNYFENLR